MSIAASFTSSKVDCSKCLFVLQTDAKLAFASKFTALTPRGQNRRARDALPALNKLIQEKM